jgi:hypothetical protein
MDENRAHWNQPATIHPETCYSNLKRFRRERTPPGRIVLERPRGHRRSADAAPARRSAIAVALLVAGDAKRQFGRAR